MSGHAFTQFKLTQKLLNNLSQFEITPTAKLVLLYLSTCYNPQKADMFPKQRTIAQKTGVSERSVVRAISELIKAGWLIVAECKYTNRYKFTSKIAEKLCMREKIFTPDNLAEKECQNSSLESDKMSPHKHEPMNEPIKEPVNVDDYKILKQYALEHNARNVNAYINWLQTSGKANEILGNNAVSKRYFTGEIKRLESIKNESYEQVDTDYFQRIKANLLRNCEE